MDMHDGFDKKSKLGVMEQAGLCGSMGLCFLAFSSVSFQVVIVYQLVQFFFLFFLPLGFSLSSPSLSPSLSLYFSLSFYFSGSSCPWDLEFFCFVLFLVYGAFLSSKLGQWVFASRFFAQIFSGFGSTPSAYFLLSLHHKLDKDPLAQVKYIFLLI